MKKKIALVLCVLWVVPAVQGIDQKNKPPLSQARPRPKPPAEAYLPPQITQAACMCLAGGAGEFEVRGKRFGDSQGSRVVRVNGSALPTVLSWQKDVIRCSHSYTFPAGEVVHLDIYNTEKNKRISNVFDSFVPFCIYKHDPDGALKAKSAVYVLAKPDVGASAWGRKVMIGAMEAQAQWLGNKIRIVVPMLDPGANTLRLEKDGAVISNGYAVTVQ